MFLLAWGACENGQEEVRWEFNSENRNDIITSASPHLITLYFLLILWIIAVIFTLQEAVAYLHLLKGHHTPISCAEIPMIHHFLEDIQVVAWWHNDQLAQPLCSLHLKIEVHPNEIHFSITADIKDLMTWSDYTRSVSSLSLPRSWAHIFRTPGGRKIGRRHFHLIGPRPVTFSSCVHRYHPIMPSSRETVGPLTRGMMRRSWRRCATIA